MTVHRFLSRLVWRCLAPLLALAIGMEFVKFHQAVQEAQAEAQRLAQALGRGVEQLLQTRLDGLQALAASPFPDSPASETSWRKEAQGIQKAFGSPVVLVDVNQRVRLQPELPIGHPTPSFPSVTSAKRAALPLAFETAKPAVGDAFVDSATREPAAVVAVPLFRGQSVDYVVASLMHSRQLEPLVSGWILRPGWTVALRDSTGTLIFSRGARLEQEATASANQSAVISAADELALVPWSVEVRAPKYTWLQHAAGKAPAFIIAVLSSLLIAAFAVGRASRRLGSSIRSLAALTPAAAPHGEIFEIHQAQRLIREARASQEAALESLSLRDAQLRGIFDSASDAIITTDESQTIVLANPAAGRIFAYRVEQLIGTPLAKLLPERLRSRHQQQVEEYGRCDGDARAMGGRLSISGLRSDGIEFPMEAAISHVNAGGQRLFTVVLRDITERLEAEAAIGHGKARLEAMLQSMDDGVAIADAQHRIVQVNAAFVRMYGLKSMSECLRQIIEFEALLEFRTLDGAMVTRDQWTMPRALRGERGSGVELQILHKDTGRRWIGSFSFAPIRDAQGQIEGAVFSVRDVTEQKRLADELKVSHSDLERLLASQTSVQEQERKRIARELHDELQQVLAAIKMDIGSILPEMAIDVNRVPSLVSRMDDLASAAINSSRRIVNDLRPPLLEEFGLVAALELLATQFMERWPIHVQVNSDPECCADGEPEDAVGLCLYRLAQEALNNVAKHSRAREVEVRLARTPLGGWQLQITDDGRGLRSEDRRKPTSFGLRSMTERVRGLGGSLHVESDSGRGVTITARLGPSEAQPTVA